VCYNNVVKELREGGQILIFVHSRNQTMVTAEDLIDRSSRNSDDKILFSFSNDLSKSYFELECRKAKDHRCLSIMQHGVGVHHAGLSMTDRRLIESLFSKGNFLFCTKIFFLCFLIKK
jgi:replicative superfamily II helicase